MGQFDFTYADNGRNILREGGYVYLTKEFAKRTRFPNPVRFLWTDDYGMFTFRIRKEFSTLDIYAVYGCMAYLDMMETKPGYLETLEETLRDSVFRYIDLLMRRQFQRVKALEETLREFGIDTFFSGVPWKAWKPCDVTVQALGNQKEKRVKASGRYIGPVPLFITRKKLPASPGDDLAEIAESWGFCSDYDPANGNSLTKNHYCIYKKAGWQLP